MMERVLVTLIDGARLVRDRHAVAVRHAADALEKSRHMLERLAQYRGECLARSPTTMGGTPDRETLLDYQRFVGHLDNAIRLQGQELRSREEALHTAQLQLLDGQRRLMALETLVTRRATAKALQTQRKDQRNADEFAARAARRLHPDNTP